jgi:ribosome-binding factor A
MKSQRQLQIGENIKRVMSEIFLRGDILSIPGSYITILEADVSPDAKNVKIYIDIFGNESMHDKIVKALNKAGAHFRFQLAKKVMLRVIPDIIFVNDKTHQRAISLDSLIESEGFIMKAREEAAERLFEKNAAKEEAAKKVLAGKKTVVKKAVAAKKAVVKKAAIVKKVATKKVVAAKKSVIKKNPTITKTGVKKTAAKELVASKKTISKKPVKTKKPTAKKK